MRRAVCGGMAAALLSALFVLPAGAAPEEDAPDARIADESEESDESDEEPDEAEEVDPLEEAREAAEEARADVRAATQARAAARAATRSARSAGSSADGAVRAAEDAIVPEVLARREATDRLDDARARLRSLEAALREAEADLVVARERLVDRAVRAYKQGSVAADTMLPLAVFREASSPGELATAMKDLEVLALSGVTTVDELEERRTRLQVEVVTAVAGVTDAEEALEAAGHRIEDREALAADRRRVADGAESRLLSAIERELAADRAVEKARRVLDEALIELGTRTEAREGAEDDADEPSRGAQLRGRQRAHDRQQSLDPAHRRTVEDWACPVEGSRFINDWAFPRTQDRRHEGTDVFAPTGTPVVAVTDGTVTRMDTVDRFNGRSGFGGLTVTYEHGDQRFYNAHLDAIHPDMELGASVEAGDVIGWVGRTGNARSTPPHLHIGVYAEGVAVNPYPSLAVACAQD